MAKRFISLLLCITFAVTSSLTVPAFASDASGVSEFMNSDFFSWVFQAGYHTMAGIFSIFFDEVCPSAPGLTDKHSFVERHTTVDGKTGLYYICEYCGKSAGEVGKEAYDNQVAELPATGITSAGRLIWQPTFADANANTSGSSDNYFRVSYYEGAYSCNVYLNAIPNCEAITIFSDNTGFICAYSNSYFKSRFGFYFNPVIAGSYRQIESLCYSYSCLDQSGTSYSGSVNYSAGTAFLHYDASTVLFSVRSSVFNICSDLSASATVTFGTVQYHFPVYEIIPDSAVDTSAGGQYSVTTRPTSITGGNHG